MLSAFSLKAQQNINKYKKRCKASNFSRHSGASGVKGTRSFDGQTNGAN
jgi:hypothetical protein